MTIDRDPEHAVKSTQRLVGSLLKAEFGDLSTDWKDGQRPPHRLYIAVDGYVTQSFAKSTWKPWRDILDEKIGAIDSGALIRGFSYSIAGNHYLPKHTNRGIDRAARRLARDYIPSTPIPTTYIAFSLGGVIAAAGLAQTEADLGVVEALILVQPAFVLAPAFIDAEWYIESKLRPIRELTEVASLATSRTGLRRADRVLADLSSLNDRGIPIHLLYWPDDEFLTYDRLSSGKAPLTAQLHSFAGVRIGEPLKPEFVNRRNKPAHAFRDHAEIARDENTLDRLTELLRLVLQLP